MIVAIPPDALNEIMSSNQGMGETGETYLVGADGMMRTDSRYVASAMNSQPVDSVPVRRALAGEADVVEVVDYRGVTVLSAFEPVSIFSHGWALLAEVDRDEVLVPVGEAIRELLATIAAVLVLVVVATVLVGRSMASPIVQAANAMARFVEARETGAGLDGLADVVVPRNAATEVQGIATGIRDFVDAESTSERSLTALLEATPDGTLIVDMDGRIEFANHQAVETSPWTGTR